MVGWLDGWLIGWLVDCLASWLLDWSVDWLVGCLVGESQLLSVFVSSVGFKLVVELLQVIDSIYAHVLVQCKAWHFFLWFIGSVDSRSPFSKSIKFFCW